MFCLRSENSEAVTIHHIRGRALLRFVSITWWNNTPAAYLRNSYRPRKESYVTGVLHQFNRQQVPVFSISTIRVPRKNRGTFAGIFFSFFSFLFLFFLYSYFFFSLYLSLSLLFFNDSHGMINDSIMFRGTKVNSQPFTAGEKHAGCTKDGQLLYPWLCFSSTFTVVVMDSVFLYNVYTGWLGFNVSSLIFCVGNIGGILFFFLTNDFWNEKYNSFSQRKINTRWWYYLRWPVSRPRKIFIVGNILLLEERVSRNSKLYRTS